VLQPFEAHRSGRIVDAFTDGQAGVLRFLLAGQLALLDEEDPTGDDPIRWPPPSGSPTAR
jgi:hypothetical protein